MSDEGRVVRRRRFAQIPDELVIDHRVTSHAVRLWCRLDKYAGQDGQAFPARETLAADLNLSLATVARAIANLVETGWITREARDGYPSLTCLNDRPETPDPSHGRDAPRVTRETPPVSRVRHKGDPRKETQGRRPPVPALSVVSPAQDRSVENRGADATQPPTTEGEPSGPPTPPPPPPAADPVDYDGHPRHPHHGNALAKCLRLERDRRLPLDPGDLLAWCYRLGSGDPWTGAGVVDVETSAGLDGARDPRATLLARLRAAQPAPAAPDRAPDPAMAPPSRYVDPQATLAPPTVIRAMRAALARTAAVATAG